VAKGTLISVSAADLADEVVDVAFGVSVDRLRRAGFGSVHLGPVALA